MLLPFENFSEQLLRAGIAPRHVHRYVIELREHLADLTARERASGLDAKAAAERARAILGTDTQLAQEMITRGAPRSFAARVPWAAFGIIPAVTIVLLIFAIGSAMFRIFLPVLTLEPQAMPVGYHALFLIVSFVASYLVGPLFSTAIIIVALHQRLSSSWVWIGLALVGLMSGAFGFFHDPGAPFEGALHVRINGHVNAAATFAMIGIRAGVLFTAAALAYRVLRARLPQSAA